MLTARADVPTTTPGRYAKQLVAHFGEKVAVRQHGDHADFPVDGGHGAIQVGDGVLVLIAEAPDIAQLTRIKNALGRHLERFAARQEITVVWQPTAIAHG
ncbi:MAG TPA: DUF2218 domain-containing protein [Catenuloplanes sp.]|jgi:hypothetical protein